MDFEDEALKKSRKIKAACNVKKEALILESKHTSKRIEKVTEELLPLAASESVPASGEVTGLGETAAAAAPPVVAGVAGAAAATVSGFF